MSTFSHLSLDPLHIKLFSSFNGHISYLSSFIGTISYQSSPIFLWIFFILTFHHISLEPFHTSILSLLIWYISFQPSLIFHWINFISTFSHLSSLHTKLKKSAYVPFIVNVTQHIPKKPNGAY